LVETVVALGVFAIGAAAVGRFLTEQIRSAASNNVASKAYALAEQEMEAIRMLNYDEMVGRGSTQTVGNVTYTLTTTVLTDSPAANMKAITVRVDWVEPRGAKDVSLYSIYTSVKR
jgi:type II secretory pathway pseudopilin PulG